MRTHHEYDLWKIKTISLRSADAVMSASSFDPFSFHQKYPPTMKSCYWDYFPRADTDIFRRRYAAVLVPYTINPTATVAPANVAQMIYTPAQ